MNIHVLLSWLRTDLSGCNQNCTDTQYTYAWRQHSLCQHCNKLYWKL